MAPDTPGLDVELERVCKRFAAFAALDQITLKLSAGSFLLLVGGNGAGKSTLLRLLAGLSRPTQGEVRIGGDPPHSTPQTRLNIGLLAHGSLLYDELSAEENLIFFARLYGLAQYRDRVLDSLKENDLEDRRRQRVGTFSRGMKQRLSLARATLHRPGLLLMDEPYTGLDRRATEHLGHRLHRLHAGGTTIVMVTHHLEEGVNLADRLVLLRRGRLCHQTPWSGDMKTLRALYEEHLGEKDVERL
jgi:heme exporter protein A